MTALSPKQHNKIESIKSMANKSLAFKSPNARWYKPDRTVFDKLHKFLHIVYSNAPDTDAIDNCSEIHELIKLVLTMSPGAGTVQLLINETHKFNMTETQMMIVHSLIQQGLLVNGHACRSKEKIKNLLPMVESFCALIS
jgi:hypothetical protein